TITQITSIEDEVSLLVQNQYEENPYPRWIKPVSLVKTVDLNKYLSDKFPATYLPNVDHNSNVDVLIAGCGTGDHAIQTAQSFSGVRMLAVDLSISSLSYALRKTRELGLDLIEYAQADLLKISLLDRKFDLIESIGVLHHLADPWAGWRELLQILRPGGVMRLGFYSEVARQKIAAVQAFIVEHGYGSSVSEIRRCRNDLVDLFRSTNLGSVFNMLDFYSVSDCRDLLFHVQEHRLSLITIEAFLRENGLVFVGFEISSNILRNYEQRFPNNKAANNLVQWQIFENENPDTFLSMYQFWVQKVM
ncbi:MAG: methyltransferase domain-containing protein, partial [Methylococcales bacterium]|nr:methyltransferase domain-containing protein [Methylococcales bacterium]